MCVKCNIKKYQRDDLFCSASTSSTAARTAATTKAEKVQSFPWIRDSTRSIRSFGNRMVLFVVGGIEGILKDMRYTSQSIYWFSLIYQISLLCKENEKTHSHLWVRNCVQVQPAGGDGGIRTHVPISRQNDFESFSLRPLRYVSISYCCSEIPIYKTVHMLPPLSMKPI